MIDFNYYNNNNIKIIEKIKLQLLIEKLNESKDLELNYKEKLLDYKILKNDKNFQKINKLNKSIYFPFLKDFIKFKKVCKNCSSKIEKFNNYKFEIYFSKQINLINKNFKKIKEIEKKIINCKCRTKKNLIDTHINLLKKNINKLKIKNKLDLLIKKYNKNEENLIKKLDNDSILKMYSNKLISNLENKIIADSIIGYQNIYKGKLIRLYFDKSNLLIEDNFIEIDSSLINKIIKFKENPLFGNNKISYKSVKNYYNYNYNSKINKFTINKSNNNSISNYCHHCNFLLNEKYLLKCKNINFKKYDSSSFSYDEKCKLFMGFKFNKISCNKEFCLNCLKNCYYLENINPNKFFCPFCWNKCFCIRCENRDMIIKISNIVYNMYDNKLKIINEDSPIDKLIFKLYNKENQKLIDNNLELYNNYLMENKKIWTIQLELMKIIKNRENLKLKKFKLNYK